MKSVGLMMVLAGLLSLLLAAVTSCTTEQTATVKRLGNVVITAGVISGRITAADADLLRKNGALILDAPSDEARLAALSSAAVDAAVVTGAITPEEAEKLRDAGTVPISSGPPAAVPVLPAVTSSK